MRIYKSVSLSLLLSLITLSASAQITLPKLISDGIVLQRNAIVPVWGWSGPNEDITVSFNGEEYKTTASSNGDWRIELPEMKAGGPYTMTISGTNTIEVKDILIGDVWLATGQSNMVHQLDIHDILYAEEIATANYPEIRHFKMPTTAAISGPREDLAGGEWLKAVGEEVRPFSGVAYFFAKVIHQKYGIPVGLINASVGGTPIQAWTPEEGFQKYSDKFPEIIRIIEENKDTALVNRLMGNRPSFNRGPQEPSDKGLTGDKKWFEVDYEPKEWRRINIPGYWEDQGARDLNGVVWYRRTIELPASMEDEAATVFLGRIVDADELYINGERVGGTGYQYPQRRYDVPENLLKAGENVFVVRVTNNFGKGGFVPDKPYFIFTDQDTVDLKGYWQYKVGEVFAPFDFSAFSGGDDDEPRPRRINPQNEPTSLHNAMVAPYTDFPVTGILWYQGESNTGEPEIYDDYLYALIDGWREVFDAPELPFIIAQLPNFMDVMYYPVESNWAEMREAQLIAAQNSENTEMTVNIELGEWNDIHPDNKKDVGERMALPALKLAYGEDLVYSGPIYKDHTIEGNKVIISFDHVGSGLITDDGFELSDFAIAGEDKKFVWAKAKIEGDKVVVWNDDIENPMYVRYAWSDNPDNPNLYNIEGLPASPFRIKPTE